MDEWISDDEQHDVAVNRIGVRATILAIARQGLFLIPILLIGTHFWGLLGIQTAQPIADLFTLLLSVIIMSGIFKELDRKEKEAESVTA